MGYVPGYKHDLFVSYAHFDNEEDAQQTRWVSRFQADLRNALRQRLGETPEVFFDTRDLQAHGRTELLLESARQSAVFLAVFSPSYLARDFTIKELQAFAAVEGPIDRIVTVELLPVEEPKQHPLLAGRRRTPFWWRDSSEEDIPLPLTSRFNAEKYNERLQILAYQVKKLLTDLREQGLQASAAQAVPAAQATTRPATSGKPVLLAQTTDDLYGDCQRVRVQLEQFGIEVLPKDDYPQGGPDFTAAFAADLAKSGLFVQLLGGSFASRKPPDLPKTYAQHQYDAAKQASVPILQWRRPDVDLATVTHRDKQLLDGPEVAAVSLEEFKAEIIRRHKAQQKPEPETQPEPQGHCHFFINADRSDKELADSLLKLFENRGNCTAARPLFEGSATEIAEDLEANLINCEALLLVYGDAPPAWVRAQLLRYSKLERSRQGPLRLKTILFGPPTPKAEIAWSGGFEKIDCQDGSAVDRVREILKGLHL
jgi:hypothetical protein